MCPRVNDSPPDRPPLFGLRRFVLRPRSVPKLGRQKQELYHLLGIRHPPQTEPTSGDAIGLGSRPCLLLSSSFCCRP